jgi:hypothetical protein
MFEKEVIFDVREDEGGSGGWCARAAEFPIFTQGMTWAELRANVREAAACYFDSDHPTYSIRIRMVVDEVLAG